MSWRALNFLPKILGVVVFEVNVESFLLRRIIRIEGWQHTSVLSRALRATAIGIDCKSLGSARARVDTIRPKHCMPALLVLPSPCVCPKRCAHAFSWGAAPALMGRHNILDVQNWEIRVEKGRNEKLYGYCKLKSKGVMKILKVN